MNILNKKHQIEDYIKQHKLEKVLSKSSIDLLELMTFEADELIVESGASLKYLYLLLEGKARISPASENGKVGFLDFVIAMDVIGDLEYFSNDSYFYNVNALIPCVVLAIPVEFIDTLFSQNVDFYKFLCRNMSTKMKRTSLKYSKTLLYPIKDQIANYLYELYIKSGKNILPIMFKETAEFFDITPRYFRSVLVELESEGIISRENTGITIINIDKLRKYQINLNLTNI